MTLVDWLRRRRRDEDLEDEIRTHLSMAAQDRMEEGDDARHARLAALKEFGNVTLTQEVTRLSWGGAWRERLANLVEDVRYSIRVLGRSPGYALVVIAVLALGIGANVSVFSLFRALALTPLPGVEGSARLGVLAARTSAGRILPLSHPDFQDLRAQDRSFFELAGTSLDQLSLGLGTTGERVWVEIVTGNYFSVLDVRAQLGRTLLPSDDVTPGKHPVVVISDGLWKRSFGSDPAIVGRTVRLAGYPLTVVGVAEPAFRGSVVAMDVEVFAPVMMKPQLQARNDLVSRDVPSVWGLGHLRPGVAIGAAAAEADVLSARLAVLHQRQDVLQRATVMPMWQSPFGAQTYMLPAVMLVNVMGILLLFIVCANVSNLVLVRSIGRRGEIAARLALGASRGRILRLLFVESLVLSIPGALGGLLASRALLPLMNSTSTAAAAPGRIYLNVSIDGLVVVFALLLSCGCAVVFGFLPALRGSRVELATIMKDDLSPRSGSRSRARGALVVSQVAVSLMLLVGAGLVMRSLESARNANAGFDARNVASISLDVIANGYDQARARAFYDNLLDTVAAEPNVESATLALETPLGLVPGRARDFEIEGYAPRTDEDLRLLFNSVAPGYFDMLRIGVLAGRDFTRRDDESGQKVAIVNETLARRFWGAPAAALGKRLRMARNDWAVVTGVVSDIKYTRLDEAPTPFVYLPAAQYYLANFYVHVRSREASPTFVARIRARVQALDANLPILEARMLSEQTGSALAIYAMAAGVLATFGAIAALLAALGTYGMVAYAAKQSTHEIGIRLAIGASRANVVRQFLTSGLRLGAVGAICGLVASFAVMRLLTSVLYGVSASDPVSFTSASAMVMAIVLGASLIPAWRASRTDPIAALRHR